MIQSKFKAANLLAGTALVALGLAAAGQASADGHAKVVTNAQDKVKMSISGQISRQMHLVDDGFNTRFRHDDSNYASSRFRFHLASKINSNLRVAGTTEIAMDDARNGGSAQATQNGGRSGNDLQTRIMEVSFRHSSFGNLTIGAGNKAGNGTMNQNLHGVYAALPKGMALQNSNLSFRDSLTGNIDGPTALGAFGDFDMTSRGTRVRYDTPVIMGFAASVSHDDEQTVEASLRYNGRFFDTRIRAMIGYSDAIASNTDANQQYGGTMSLLHSSGLGVTGGCQYENEDPSGGGADTINEEDPYGCTIQGHYQRKFNELGMSSVVVEYEHQANLAANGDVGEAYGVTFQQNIDSSALQIFMKYAQFELERDTQLNGFDDLDIYTLGTRLRF
jgi:hypothetical protein